MTWSDLPFEKVILAIVRQKNYNKGHCIINLPNGGSFANDRGCQLDRFSSKR